MISVDEPLVVAVNERKQRRVIHRLELVVFNNKKRTAFVVLFCIYRTLQLV